MVNDTLKSHSSNINQIILEGDNFFRLEIVDILLRLKLIRRVKYVVFWPAL